MSGIKLTHVPFKGGAPAVVALMGGEVQVIITPIAELFPHINSGRVRAIAVTSAKRSAQFPELPAISETVKGYEFVSWFGCFAPAGTPKAILDRLSAEIKKALADADVSAKLTAQGLTAGVDTQADGFIYEIRAWGWGETEESWQIREGFVTSFDALSEILWSHEYKDADGLSYPVLVTVQDAMGHRTTEVYDFCRLHKGLILPFKGEARMASAIAYSRIDHYPGKTQPIPGGPIQLLRANVNYFKSKLAARLEIAPADPGAWHLHAETELDWARQMTAEYLDPETQEWVAIEGRPNHSWDVSVYNLVAAYAIGLRFWPKPSAEPEPARPRQVKPARW